MSGESAREKIKDRFIQCLNIEEISEEFDTTSWIMIELVNKKWDFHTNINKKDNHLKIKQDTI